MADDNARLRARLREALQAGGCTICAEGATADEAVQLATEHRPDVVLLDIHMPGNGIQAAVQISRALPQTFIVMLTASQEDDDLFDSLLAEMKMKSHDSFSPRGDDISPFGFEGGTLPVISPLDDLDSLIGVLEAETPHTLSLPDIPVVELDHQPINLPAAFDSLPAAFDFRERRRGAS